MSKHGSKGQGLLIIAMIIMVAVLVLAMLYRIFIMTPAYIYERSVYFIFKYNPQIVIQGLSMSLSTALMSFAVNYSNYLLNYGIALQLPTIQGANLAPQSLMAVINEEYNQLTQMLYTPTGLAVPVSQGSYVINPQETNYYGALSLLNYVYSASPYSTLYVALNNTYDMPIIGIHNLTLSNGINLTAYVVSPSTSTCSGNVYTYSVNTEIKCLFSFTANTYTCTNGVLTSTGAAMSLWAPSYTALQKNRIVINSNGIVDSNSKYADPVLFLVPVDEAWANNGIKISFLFAISNPSNFLFSVNFLAQYPTTGIVGANKPGNYLTGYWVSIYPSGNKYYIGFGIGSSTITSQSISNLNTNGNNNLTIYITCPQSGCNPFTQNPTAQISIYLNPNPNNPKPVISGYTIYLPYWSLIYSSLFQDYAYIFGNNYQGYGIGSWLIMMLQNTDVSSASIKLYSTYTLPSNVYISVSVNNQPALSAYPILLTENGQSVSMSEVPYNVCNITSNAIIFNVTLPYPNGYPYTQYLLLLNYSNIINALNPYSPQTLTLLGLQTTPYNATAMVSYVVGIYSSSSSTYNELVYVMNNGIPTLMLFYNSTDVALYNGYVTLDSVSTSAVNILPHPSSTLLIYTLRELLIHLPSGYTALTYTTPQSVIQLLGPPINYPAEFYYTPSSTHETLPMTYANYTIVNCAAGNGITNYEIFLTPYDNYLAYYSYGSYNNPGSIGSC